jgi:hypothetical protein
MDEILYKQKVFSIPISPNVTQFFKYNNHLQYVKNEKGEEYPLPYQLYICKSDYDNLSKTEFEQNELTTIEHPKLCNAFYFTSDPTNNVFIDNLQRFSCFIVKCLYIEEDFSNANDEMILAASTIYFHENTVQFWCIKNITQFTIIP